jgi:hypothetical protein
MRWQTRELAAAKVHTLSIRRGQEQFAKESQIALCWILGALAMLKK